MPRPAVVVPPRMFGVLSSRAKIGVLLRQEPTRWYQMILWHTDTDSFERGQWVHHRIEAAGCDLSPDGKLFVYGARDGRTRNKYEKWVAVSIPPYFTALALWPVTGPGGGSGMFENLKTLVLYGQIGENEKHFKVPLDVVTNKSLVPFEFVTREVRQCHGAVELARLYREQWRYNATHARWERPLNNGRWNLCLKRTFGVKKAVKLKARLLDDEYTIRFGEVSWTLSGADWAGIDHRGRLVFTRDGKLFAGRVSDRGVEESVIADFSADKPEPLAPPISATHWPH